MKTTHATLERSVALLSCAALIGLVQPVECLALDIPTPANPDSPDPCAGCGGGDKVPSPSQVIRCATPKLSGDPSIYAGRIVNGHVHFDFGLVICATNVMKYNVRWSRNGGPLQTDIRYPEGGGFSELTLNEIAPAGAVYRFEVQAVGKYKIVPDARGVLQYQQTNFVSATFAVPAAAPAANAARIQATQSKLTDRMPAQAKAATPNWGSVPH